MKKLILSLILFLSIPLMVNAANYDITNQYIKAEILNNGDLKVRELIVMDGTFNGYEKTLSYKNDLLEESNSYANNALYNGSNIELVSIEGKYVDNVSFDTFNDDFTNFSSVNYASNGDIAKYTTKSNYNGYTYRMYYKANNQKVAFLITYIVKDVVVLHNDVAEAYWNFITPNDYDDINDIKIEVLLPNNDNSDNFRIWAHGNLSGEVSKLNDNRGLKAEISYMEASANLDIRVTFSKDLITDTTNVKRNNTDALPSIIEVETKRAEVANELRAELLKKYNFGVYSSIIFLVTSIIVIIFIYFKYGKSPKSTYYSKYNREFIDDYNVEVIDYLMHKKITPNAMSASIMNLIYKKNISVKEIDNSKKKNKKDYVFTLENTDNLKNSEVTLVEFLFDKVGHKNTDGTKNFSTIDLKNYANGTKTCNKFISSYTSWKNSVTRYGEKEQFYEKSAVPIGICIGLFIIGVILFIYNTSNGIDFFLLFFVPIMCIILMFYGILVDKKTIKGVDHYTKWKAFKNFLNDFGAFDIKELPEIVLWERYLVYATIFGLADKVQKVMNVKIHEFDETAVSYIPSYFYFDLGSTINTSVNNALNSAYSRQAANYSNSHSSSSSGGGFGGGFSSGGGFGGGGSSGHGF
ncbi:MAG: DUF2207 domain-containing protein [Ruminococcus sp.]|nr:DUF2207 domain-containing protein [Ruminococcus sp.]